VASFLVFVGICFSLFSSAFWAKPFGVQPVTVWSRKRVAFGAFHAVWRGISKAHRDHFTILLFNPLRVQAVMAGSLRMGLQVAEQVFPSWIKHDSRQPMEDILAVAYDADARTVGEGNPKLHMPPTAAVV
jgi:hypothetical protein